jgi:myo-inositol-1-phosphate synthase
MNNKNSKVGVLIPGMGAVASTFICGVLACNKGLSKPIGSMTQMGSIRLGKKSEDRSPIIKDFIPVADMNNLVFGGWDINNENVYDISIRSRVLEKTLLDQLKPELETINIFKGVFDKEYVRRLSGNWVKTGISKMDLAEQVIADI